MNAWELAQADWENRMTLCGMTPWEQDRDTELARIEQEDRMAAYVPADALVLIFGGPGS